MSVLGICFVPDFGHYGNDYDFGPEVPGINGVQAVNRYVLAAMQTLDKRGIPCRAVPTRVSPGIPLWERPDWAPDGWMTVYASVGCKSTKSRPTRNITRVAFGQRNGFDPADLLIDAIGEWGKCKSYGHRVAAKKRSPERHLHPGSQSWSVEIEPFVLNGPQMPAYVSDLEGLGKVIGVTLADWCEYRWSLDYPSGSLQSS